MPNGGTMKVTATPFSHVEDDTIWCEIVIADTGGGIPREYMGKIFDPFFTTKKGGTGLGLAIVYRIIEDHGGLIEVDSEQGRGTQFRIRLPMVEESAYEVIKNNKTLHVNRKTMQTGKP